MSTPESLLSPETIQSLIEPYVGATSLPSVIYPKLASYLQLILKWNARINLTAIRSPEEIVRRHFGESLFAALRLNPPRSNELKPCTSLLDLGSGAGFPGIPIQLLFPELKITLAESRVRKAAFLREVIRTLDLKASIWPGRAEAMPSSEKFHTVALRAVDEMDFAIREAANRAAEQILILGTVNAKYSTLASRFRLESPILVPNSSERALWIARRAG